MLAPAVRFSTHDDYLAWADTRPDEERYEIVEGYPVMSPGPGYLHQLCQANLLGILREACPPGLVVLAGPFDWVLWELPRLQMREPDLLVMRRPANRQIRRIDEPPLLAVEILSESSVERDVFVKRREYARAGLEQYWIVDPEAPSVSVLRLAGDDMEVAANASGAQLLALDAPIAISFAPDDLLA